MIGLDSNILIRVITRDDDAQFHAASRILDEAPKRSLLVNLIVIVETVWTLRRAYRLDDYHVEIALRRLTEHPGLFFPQLDQLREAIHRSTEFGADIADQLIALTNRAAGCETTLTFDTSAARSDDFTLLPS